MTVIDAEPYRWPWDGQLVHDRLAVIVAGAQYFWADRTVGAAEASATFSLLASALREQSTPIIWIRHGREPDSRNTIPQRGGDEWQLVVAPPEGDLIVDAAGHDGCYGSRLDATLRSLGRDQLMVMGLGLEGPVHSTVRSLNDRGYECLTIDDACAAYDDANRAGALSTIVLSFGIFGAVATAPAVLRVLCPEVVST